MQKIIFLAAILLFPGPVYPVHFDLLSVVHDSFLIRQEDTLIILFNQLHTAPSNREKNTYNERINQLMQQLFTDTLSFFYPFHRLNKLGKIYSPDSLIRIYTWNITYEGGNYHYSGYIQQLDTTAGIYRVHQLIRKSGTEIHTDSIYTAENWYGALYYDIIFTPCAGKKNYTLLGADFNNLFISKKIIDILTFDEKNKPVFGKPAFYYKGQLEHRVIFEFSARVSMSLKYDRKLNMIVFDHLSPSQSKYIGKYEFYGPDFSYDAFRYLNCRWVFEEDIDVRNR